MKILNNFLKYLSQPVAIKSPAASSLFGKRKHNPPPLALVMNTQYRTSATISGETESPLEVKSSTKLA